jgi:hypothetical protein
VSSCSAYLDVDPFRVVLDFGLVHVRREMVISIHWVWQPVNWWPACGSALASHCWKL